MIDFLGKEINVGDTVVYSLRSGYAGVRTGKVIKINEVKITIGREGNNPTYQYGTEVIVITKLFS